MALIDMFKPHTHAILTTAPGLGLVFFRLGVLEGRVEDGPELLVRSSDSSVKVELTKDQNLHDKCKRLTRMRPLFFAQCCLAASLMFAAGRFMVDIH